MHNKLDDFCKGMKVKHVEDPDVGIVQNVDHEEHTVVVDFPVRGAYGHPNGIIDVDPSELEIVS